MQAQRASVKYENETAPLPSMKSRPISNSGRAMRGWSDLLQSVCGCSASTGRAAVMRTRGGLTQ